MAEINTSQIFNSQYGFVETINGLNAETNYLLGVFLLVAIFLMVLFLLRGWEFRNTFVSASTVTLLTAYVFWLSSFILFSTLVVCFSIWLVSFFNTYQSNN